MKLRFYVDWFFIFVWEDVSRAVHQIADMYLSAKAPSACQKQMKSELHLDGGRWGRMLSQAQLFAPLHHTHKPQ